MIIWSHALKQSARLSPESLRARQQDKIRREERRGDKELKRTSPGRVNNIKKERRERAGRERKTNSKRDQMTASEGRIIEFINN